MLRAFFIGASMSAVCRNCDWEGPVGDVVPARDLLERVMPGDVMPAGKCPKCHWLAYERRKVDEKFEVYQYIDASTAHMTKRDTELLARYSLLHAIEYDEGFWIWLDPDLACSAFRSKLVTQGLSEALVKLLRKAERQSDRCTWLRFDADGTLYDNFPKFEW